MGVIWRPDRSELRDGEQLTREAMPPLPAERRPCWLVAIAIAIAIGVGAVQGAIDQWHQAQSREDALHLRAIAAEAAAAAMERQVRELRAELRAACVDDHPASPARR